MISLCRVVDYYYFVPFVFPVSILYVINSFMGQGDVIACELRTLFEQIVYIHNIEE